MASSHKFGAMCAWCHSPTTCSRGSSLQIKLPPFSTHTSSQLWLPHNFCNSNLIRLTTNTWWTLTIHTSHTTQNSYQTTWKQGSSPYKKLASCNRIMSIIKQPTTNSPSNYSKKILILLKCFYVYDFHVCLSHWTFCSFKTHPKNCYFNGY